MFVSLIVVIPADDGAAEGLTFPLAGIADEADYTFDFGPWLGGLDRVADCSVLSDTSLTLGTITFDASHVTARLGPATQAGTHSVGCSIITSQNRIKTVSAAVTVQ